MSALKENDAICLVWSEGQCVSGNPFAKSDVEFEQVLFPIGLIKCSKWWRIGQSEGCCLPSGQCQTSCLLVGISYYTYHIHLWISPYFNPYKIILIERISVFWKPVETAQSSSSPRKMPTSGRMESWSIVKSRGTK